MAVTQYIGARYVPKFYENSDGTEEWRAGVEYEPLTIVTYNGNSYTSKKPVPSTVGNPSANPAYWASTGNYNQQVEEYRQEVEEYKAEVDGIETRVNDSLENFRNRLQSLEYRRFVLIGDSYAEGYTPDGNVTGWTAKLRELLGKSAEDCEILYKGGAGFAAAPQGKNFFNLLDDSSISDPESVTDVIVCGGYNDKDQAGTAIYNAISIFCNACRTKYPNATIRIGEVGWSTREIYKLSQIVNHYIKAAADYGAVYLNNVEYSLHDYNSLFASDGVHANEAGQKSIARNVFNAILTGSADVVYAYKTSTTANPIGSGAISLSATMHNSILSMCIQGVTRINLTTPYDYGEATGGRSIKLADITGGLIMGNEYPTINIPVTCFVRYSAGFVECPGVFMVQNGGIYLKLQKLAGPSSWLALNGIEYIEIMPFTASYDSIMC